MNKILIAGGTGFVGKALISFLVTKGYEVHALTRRQLAPTKGVTYFKWDIAKQEIDLNAFSEVDTIINMTGANISEKRWSDDRKKVIINSRVQSLELLHQAVYENDFKIKRIISSSAVGYYGAVTNQHIYTEEDKKGDDFLAEVCEQWESAAMAFENLGSQVVILRKGVIIGHGGMYEKLSGIAKYGINPALGSGKQYIAWIAMNDLLELYGCILEKENMHGVFNAVSSHDMTMNDLSKAILGALGKRKITPNAPGFIIKLMFGELSTMMLKGSRASSQKVNALGCNRKDETIEQVIQQLVDENK